MSKYLLGGGGSTLLAFLFFDFFPVPLPCIRVLTMIMLLSIAGHHKRVTMQHMHDHNIDHIR